jgi:hypothetical protein
VNVRLSKFDSMRQKWEDIEKELPDK